MNVVNEALGLPPDADLTKLICFVRRALFSVCDQRQEAGVAMKRVEQWLLFDTQIGTRGQSMVNRLE